MILKILNNLLSKINKQLEIIIKKMNKILSLNYDTLNLFKIEKL
jgi:hypothetical protein